VLSHETTRPQFTERRRVLLLADLAGFTRAVAPLRGLQFAELVDDFYRLAADVVQAHGGTIVKFVGDGCLAVFDEENAVAAVSCAQALRPPVRELGERHGVALDLGANVHLSTVVEGRFGAGPSAANDVVGAGVIHAFRMGAGPGIRISETVYRKQPNDARGPWRKHQPPATYTLSD
jgi:adenylate cyclase